ncbi:MAG: AI-2E family transporter [Chitinophagaceae bacterium]|jgi:predicted PurR-regulated permease PerM|nr:AI-2E family transporter [Chitinophagaceae bacterium]
MNNQFPFYLKFSSMLLSVILLFFILYIGQNVLMPLAFACLFCIVLIAPCNYFEKIGIGKGFAALLSALIAVVVFGFIFYFVSSQIISFRDQLPVLQASLKTSVENLHTYTQERFHLTPTKMDSILNTVQSKTLTSAPALVSTTVSKVSNVLLYTIMIIIYTFLLLLYRKLIINFCLAVFHNKYGESVRDVLSKIRFVIKNYVAGLLIETLIVAAMICIGFLIVGVKYAFLLGVIAALLNLIPYLGMFTAALLTMLITYATGSPSMVLGAVIVLWIVHLIDSNVLLPQIVGSKVKINALVTIIGVIVGSQLWGIAGMFLAVPIIAIIKVVLDGIPETQAWGLLLGEDAHHVHHKGKLNILVKKLVHKRPPVKKEE